MGPQHLSFASIDDYLGPAEQRFFGAGFRRVTYHFGAVGLPGSGGVEAAPPVGLKVPITIGYPADWSKKKANVDLRPHLSTVDVLVLGAQIAELQLIHDFGFNEEHRRAMWVRRVMIKAGHTPQEELISLPATARRIETRLADDGSTISVVECKVGVMQATYDIVHPAAPIAAQKPSPEALAAALAAVRHSYYGDGFKLRQQRVEKVTVDMGPLRSEAMVRIEDLERRQVTEGLEGGYRPGVSLVDSFVVVLQMVQVLLYELDQVPRSASNTLWMLRTVLEASSPNRPDATAAALPAHAAITGKHLVRMRGGQWRNIDIAGGFGGVSLRASFAHELPAFINSSSL